jgi:hypothetical protein
MVHISFWFTLVMLTYLAKVKDYKEKQLVGVSKETQLDVNADKTKYMLKSRDQNAGRTHSIKIYNSLFERVVEFKY